MVERFARRGAQAPNPFAAPAPAPARPPQAARVLPTGKAPLVEMRLGVASMYKTEKPFSSVVVGAPSIMEVHVVTDRTITLVRVALGLTNVLFLDEKGDPVGNVELMILPRSRTSAPAASGSTTSDR